MNISNLSDKIVFSKRKNLKYGFLELKNHDGKNFKFGDPESPLRSKNYNKKV